MEHSGLLGSVHMVNAMSWGSLGGIFELRHCEEEGEAARGMEEERLVYIEDVPVNIESTSPQLTTSHTYYT